jgi:hypothetical protein
MSSIIVLPRSEEGLERLVVPAAAAAAAASAAAVEASNHSARLSLRRYWQKFLSSSNKVAKGYLSSNPCNMAFTRLPFFPIKTLLHRPPPSSLLYCTVVALTRRPTVGPSGIEMSHLHHNELEGASCHKFANLVYINKPTRINRPIQIADQPFTDHFI